VLAVIGLAAGLLGACAEATPTPGVALERADGARARCTAAAQRFRDQLAAAAEGCLSDAGCTAFDSCHAVVRDRGASVLPLRTQMQQACQAAPDAPVELECAGRPVRCVAQRCLRF
jgi:hypothetical protein